MINKAKVCVLTGAGMSAESGIATFRDKDGLWEGHDVMKVASWDGWIDNMSLVLDFYNKRRQQLFTVKPNTGHYDLTSLEQDYHTVIITQNVDDLHERAGSSKIIHLHGELKKARSSGDDNYVIDCLDDINIGHNCPMGHQIRPHIVWFGEGVPMLEKAIVEIIDADFILIIGTSMQVYPAAGLIAYAKQEAIICYVDPNPSINYELSTIKTLKVFKGKATIETKKAIDYIRAHRY